MKTAQQLEYSSIERRREGEVVFMQQPVDRSAEKVKRLRL
jgi:hypothetical protein